MAASHEQRQKQDLHQKWENSSSSPSCLSSTFMEIQSRESCFWERGQNMSGGIGLRAVTNKQWLRDDYGLIEFHAWRQMSRASLVSVVAFAASELHRSRRRHSHRRRHLGVLWGNNAPFHLLHENERLWGIYECCAPTKQDKDKSQNSSSGFQKWLGWAAAA